MSSFIKKSKALGTGTKEKKGTPLKKNIDKYYFWLYFIQIYMSSIQEIRSENELLKRLSETL